MTDQRLIKMASVIVNYSLAIKKDDYVLIQGYESSIPLIKEVFRHLIKKGANPEVRILVEDLDEILLKNASDEQLQFLSPTMSYNIEKIDAFLHIGGRSHPRSLMNVDPKKITLYEKSQIEITRKRLQRAADGKLRWCVTQYPTYSGAMDAEMSLSEYEDFIFSACFVDKEDPVAEWQNLKNEQQKIIDYISTKDKIRILSKDTDLSLRVKDRKWINSCGTTNFPSGEVFTGPIEDSLNGHIRFQSPTIVSGKEVSGIYLEFVNGKVTKASAEKGNDILNEKINMDDGSSYTGEFAIATNYGIKSFTKNILFDEKIGGTIHIALGNAYPQTGSKNTSALHWDMICDMRNGGEMYADGELFYKDGRFIK